MPKIQDIVVTSDRTIGKPCSFGEVECPRIQKIPMTIAEHEGMVQRIESSILKLMDNAGTIYDRNCHKPGSSEIDQDYITRLSTNEFFFYGQEPLTPKEFERIQNKIADKAKTLPSGVHLILGSFAVLTERNCVMNVTPHIQCGDSPSFHFTVKSNTSPTDVRYKEPSYITGGYVPMALKKLDIGSPSPLMPTINVDGKLKQCTFDNIILCKTPGGSEFLTAVDICLDHSKGVAQSNYKEFKVKNPDKANLTIHHVVVSNFIALDSKKILGSDIVHVDPIYSKNGCKQNTIQGPNPYTEINFELPFGKDPLNVFVVGPCRNYLKNNYFYKVSDATQGRNHGRHTASISQIASNSSADLESFTIFKERYKNDVGDYLKTKILFNLQEQIENTTNEQEFYSLKSTIQNSPEYKVLEK